MSVNRVPVKPALLRWARERARYGREGLSKRFPKIEAWERGEVQPTLKQLKAFAKATHAPFGYFFLTEPPVESIPIPDFRTVANLPLDRPSLDLIDTINLCEERQDWYRDFAQAEKEPQLEFVGSARVSDDIVETAAQMRHALGIDLGERAGLATWTDALRRLIEQAEACGILVMVSGVVGSNNRRRLDPQEFRGFALADPWAPLVFVNGADTKAAQMFTLTHEFAHLWLGKSGISDVDARRVPSQESERWCNRVAAELLVPLAVLRDELDPSAGLTRELNRLARRYKVSTLVILRRIHDAGRISRKELSAAYDAEVSRLKLMQKDGGGNFYSTMHARVSKRFARALMVSVLECGTSFTEGFRMLGLKKMASFEKLRRNLGVGY